MSEVKRYECNGSSSIFEDENGGLVDYGDYAALEAKCASLAAENAGLKSSREILAKNTLEACNVIASAGFSHEAIMRGLYASTGNGNKYPKPITTLVDEALRDFQTTATDAFLAEVRAQGVDMARNAMIDFVDGEVGPNKNVPGLIRGAEICVSIAEQLRKGGEQK